MNDAVQRALKRLDADPRPTAALFEVAPTHAESLVVLPSAFNPPTLAHAHLLEAALRAAKAASAVALLTTRNVDKGVHGASLAHRIGMLTALRAELPFLTVAASNQARIIDQAVALDAAFERARLDFVVGFDTLERLFAARYYTEMERELEPFFARHRVFAANRGGVSPAQVAAWITSNAGPFAGRITVLEIDDEPASLSSTGARSTISAGAVAPEVSPSVRQYIQEHRLYRGS